MAAGEEAEAGPWGEEESTSHFVYFRHGSGIHGFYSGQICAVSSVYLRHEPLLIRARRSEFAKLTTSRAREGRAGKQ
jgi:hypothetical protein